VPDLRLLRISARETALESSRLIEPGTDDFRREQATQAAARILAGHSDDDVSLATRMGSIRIRSQGSEPGRAERDRREPRPESRPEPRPDAEF